MSIVRPSPWRAALMAMMVFGCLLAPASAALAHNGTGGSSSDYRIQITGWQGDHTGIELRIVELGNRLELHRTTAQSVMILGYSGEPYLRLDRSGVSENVNSPAHYLDLDRFASMNPPATASATAVPSWSTLSTGPVVRWHDHRAHWMSNTPRADVLAAPDVERVIFAAHHIDFVVDGRNVDALIRVTWLPTPMRYVWLGAASALGLGAAAALVLVPSTHKLLPVLGVLGTVATLVGQGASSTRHVLGLIAILAAVLAIVIRRPLLAVVAAIGAGVLAATRIEALEHELLAGWPTAVVQRVALVVGIACCLGVVASSIVGALEPTRPVAPNSPDSPDSPTGATS
jgi:hypothetical protein